MKHVATKFAIVIGIGFGLIFGLLSVLGVRPLPARAAGPILYVAPGGSDTTGCTNSSNPCATTQYAVNRADPGAEIRVAAGTYTDVHVYPRADFVTTGVVTQVVYVSKSLTLRGGYTTTNWTTSYPVSQPTVLDARGRGRGIYVTGDISVSIEGLLITNSTPDLTEDYDCGGAMLAVTATIVLKANRVVSNVNYYDGQGLCLWKANAVLIGNSILSHTFASHGGGVALVDSSATLVGNTFFNNLALFGGGLYLWNTTAIIRGNTFYSNTAWGGGGGVYPTASVVTLTGNTIISNHATDYGGGVYMDNGTITVENNRFISNTTYGRGGGIYLGPGEAVIVNNTIEFNAAFLEGGGFYLGSSPARVISNAIRFNSARGGGGGLLYMGNPILTGNQIISNYASDYGGGLVAWDGVFTFANNIIADNYATSSGGAIHHINPLSRFIHNTFARNYAGDGTGIYIAGNALFTDTILVSHSVGISVDNFGAAQLEATLWGEGAWANDFETGGPGVVTIGTINVYGDPGFVNSALGDYHIGQGSAAIDAGVNAGVTADIDGDARPIGMGYDIGADEFPSAMLAPFSQVNPNPVLAGSRLTYTLGVTNTGVLSLTATITDNLPGQVIPTGLLTWTPVIIAPGGVWTQNVFVTAMKGYSGTLTNTLRVTTLEGASGTHVLTSRAITQYRIYLPVVLRQ